MARVMVWATRGSLVAIAPAVEMGVRFARTAIASRTVSPEELGTAIALTLVVAAAGLMVDMAFDKFVVSRSNDSRAIGAAHILSLFRGAALACVLAVSAPAIANGFGVPQFSTSFAIIGLIPLVQSFSHLGVKQLEASYDFAPEMKAQIFCALSSVVALVIGLALWRDHRAMMLSMFVNSLFYVIASHVLARSQYKLTTDKEMMYTILLYAAPLTINGIGLAVVSQLDRILVGHWFNVETLALYAIILNLAGVPVSLIDRTVGKLGLSYLVSNFNRFQNPQKEHQGSSSFQEVYQDLVFVFSVVAAAYALFVASTFDVLVPLIFGHQFSVSPIVHILITLRVYLLVQMVGAPSRLLLATGRTRALAALSISSALGLVLAAVFIRYDETIESVILALTIADLLRFPVYFLIASKRNWLIEGRVVTDLAISGVVVAAVVGLMICAVNNLWAPRGLIFGVGLVALLLQIAIGLRLHPKIRMRV